MTIELTVMGGKWFLQVSGYRMSVNGNEMHPSRETFMQQGWLKNKDLPRMCRCGEKLHRREMWVLRVGKYFKRLRFGVCECGRQYICIRDLPRKYFEEANHILRTGKYPPQ